MKRTYLQLPEIITNYPLDTYEHGWFGVIVPQARTNIVWNPSVETATTGYASLSGSISRVTTQQYHGIYSLEVTPTTDGTGAQYGSQSDIALTSGVTYAVSVKWKGVAGVRYALGVRTSGGALLTETQFVATGDWQWVWLFYTETSTTTRRIYFTKLGSNTSPFYIDGLQVEACGSEGVFVTTYIDGDQSGLVPNQFPPAYLWTGVPHASASTRSGQTRAGGRVLKFSSFGFLLTAIIGLGLITPEHAAVPFSFLDGAQYQRTRFPQRQFTLTGRLSGRSPRELQQQRSDLLQLFSRDTVATAQPLVLTYEAFDGDGAVLSHAAQIRAVYQEGAGGEADNLFAQSLPITFTQYLPVITTRDAGATLDTQDSIASVNNIIRRNANGVWEALGTGTTSVVYALVQGLDGLIYVGGDFTDAGGSGADYLASYNPVTGAWAVVGSATSLNAAVNSLAVAADGSIIVGGDFSNAGGIAAADFIARYTPGVGYSAIGASGANNTVETVLVASTGDIYAGGTFTDIGGSGADFVARWNGTTWNTIVSATAFNNQVLALTEGLDGLIYIGGLFTNANGDANADNIVAYNATANTIAALSTGITGGVQALATGLNGIIYVGGSFGSAGGITADLIASWNGVSFSSIGNADFDTGSIRGLKVLRDGTLIGFGQFNTLAGVPLADAIFRWNGAAFTSLDVNLPGSPTTVFTALELNDGSLYVGMNNTGTATASGITTVTNIGTARAYPTIIFKAVSNAGGRIYQVTNLSTNRTIYFNYTIQDGETLTLKLQPDNIQFTSTFRGNIISAIIPGSNEADFFLQRGENRIAVYTADSDTAAFIQWPISYESLDDLVLAP